MTLRFEDLGPAIERNDVLAVVALLSGASEAQRRAVRPRVRAFVERNWDFQGQRPAAGIAVLGTAGGVRQIRQLLLIGGLNTSIDAAIAVLADRSASWTSALPAALLAGRDNPNLWRLARAMVRCGLAPKPQIPEYTTRMPYGLAPLMLPGDETPNNLEAELRDDPDLLTDEVFQLFRVEGASQSLSQIDGWLNRSHPQATWRATLARLAKAGAIDYDRLLDECLNVFLRDLPPRQLGWYVGMHTELAPTLDDLSARGEQYARLLAADASAGIGLAQATLELLLRAGRLDLERFIAAAAPVVHRAEKGIVLKQLKLLALVAKQRPDLAPRITEVIAPALAHERPEIREAALALAPGSSHTAVRPHIDVQVHDRQALLDRSLVPIGPGARLAAPISDPEELLAVLTQLIEDARDPLLLERALAGAVRTARIPVAQRRAMAEPLAKRAREQLPGFQYGLVGGDVRAMVASVAYTWATGTRVSARVPAEFRDFAFRPGSSDKRMAPLTPSGVFAVRAAEAVRLIASGASTELLAEPTHEPGTIDPEIFVERARHTYGGWLGSGPPRYDLEIAALRLNGRELGTHSGALPRRVKGTLDGLLRELPSAIAPTIVARPPTDGWGRRDEPVVLAQVTPIGRDGGILRTLTSLEDPFASHVRFGAEFDYRTGIGASIATWPLIAPWHPELIAAHLLWPLSRGLRPGRPDSAASALTCLAHPQAPLGATGHLALAMGCNGAEGDTRTTAADVFALTAHNGRLDPRLMAEAWLVMARAGIFQSKRAEATLRPLVSEPAAAIRLAQTLQLALGPLVELGIRDLHVLLRLAAALAETSGIVPHDSRLAELAERTGSSELVAAARAVAAARGAALC